MHHGIKGQKWGEQNGPPYPLDSKDYSKAEQKANAKYISKANTKAAVVVPVPGVHVHVHTRKLSDRAKSEYEYLKKNKAIQNSVDYIISKYGKDTNKYYDEVAKEVDKIVGNFGNINIKRSALTQFTNGDEKGRTNIRDLTDMAIRTIIANDNGELKVIRYKTS